MDTPFHAHAEEAKLATGVAIVVMALATLVAFGSYVMMSVLAID